MVLYKHSIDLHLSHLFIILKKNLIVRVKIVQFLIYYAYETKEHTFTCIGKSVRSGSPHITSYIITWLHLLNLDKVELFVLFHVRLHRNESSFSNNFNIGSMEEYYLFKK